MQKLVSVCCTEIKGWWVLMKTTEFWYVSFILALVQTALILSSVLLISSHQGVGDSSLVDHVSKTKTENHVGCIIFFKNGSQTDGKSWRKTLTLKRRPKMINHESYDFDGNKNLLYNDTQHALNLVKPILMFLLFLLVNYQSSSPGTHRESSGLEIEAPTALHEGTLISLSLSIQFILVVLCLFIKFRY